MTHIWKAVAGCAVAALIAAPSAAQTAPGGAAGPAAPKLVLEPEAEAALNRMGASLRAMKSFEATADFSVERVYPGNHKIMSLGRSVYTVQFPDRIRVDMQSELSHRRVYYDGTRMTVTAPKAGKYVTFPVSGSVGDVLAAAYEDYGLEFPLQDLFRWGDPTSTVARPTAGVRIGETMFNGRRVVHYGFVQPGVDFQVWLDETGTQTLPLKMVITNTEHPAQPQFIARYSWNQAPEIGVDTFIFTPSPNDKLIDFGTAKAALGK